MAIGETSNELSKWEEIRWVAESDESANMDADLWEWNYEYGKHGPASRVEFLEWCERHKDNGAESNKTKNKRNKTTRVLLKSSGRGEIFKDVTLFSKDGADVVKIDGKTAGRIRNIYNHGVYENFRQMLFPRYIG